MWWINQGAPSYNVWTYHFPSVSTSLQAYSLLSETICLCCMDTSSVVVVSTDAFQVMTDCWHAHAGSHIITQPQTQTRFLSHMYTNFYIHSPAHTGAHPDIHVKLCQRQWKYGAHFQGADRVLKEESISNVPDLIDSERRVEPTVVFCLSVSDNIAPSLNQLA